MKTLHNILESILDVNLDIDENDVRPIRNWVLYNLVKNKKHIRATSNTHELYDIIVDCGYGKYVGTPGDINWDDFLQDIVRSKELFMVWHPNINFIEIWEGRKARGRLLWACHSQGSTYGSSWNTSNDRRPNQDIMDSSWMNKLTARSRDTRILRIKRQVLTDIISAFETQGNR